MEQESYEYEGKGAAQGDVREALILAGIAEIEENGPEHFSLRRVAAKCGVSCAAPYKHFKSKEDLMDAIVGYIDEKHLLLEQHILDVFPARDTQCLEELCLASVRFWIGNPHFRAVRMMRRVGSEGAHLARTAVGSIAEQVLSSLCASHGLSEEARVALFYTVRSLVTGATLMLEDGTLENTPDTFRMLRASVRTALPF